MNTLLESTKKVLSFYYGDISTNTLEKLSFNELNKFNVSDIKNIAKELNLDFNYKKLDSSFLKEYMLPCIAIDSKKHSFVILRAKKNYLFVYDTITSKTHKVNINKFDNSALEFIFLSKKHKEINYIDDDKRDNKDWFYQPIIKEWKSYIEIGLLTIFINIFGIAVSLFAMNVYNRVVPNFAVDTLLVLAIGVGGILIFDIILKSARVYILNRVIVRISNELEEKLFQKTLTIESKHDNYLVGTKANLFRELGIVKEFFTNKILNILDMPFFILSSFIIYMIDPVMVYIPIGFAAILILVNFIMQYPIGSLHSQSFKHAQSKNAYLVEHLHGKDDLKTTNAISKTMYKWRDIIDFYNRLNQKIHMLSSTTSFVSYSLVQAVSVATIFLGVYEINRGNLNVGGLIAVTILASRSMVPVINLSNIVVKYKQVKDSLEVLNRYWHLPTETSKPIELGVDIAQGDIEFKDVEFKYETNQYKTLSNINLKIKKGEKVGIIGQTGSGKSTLVKLLLGIETPTKGKIFLDDMDTNTMHPIELRENISFMPQEPYLFSGTLKENLELKKSISKREMTIALKNSGLLDLVKQSGGIDSVNVSEGGKNLSVGQRRLVGVARMLLNDAPIVILDEPTTGLDIGLEKKLVDMLDQSLKSKTTIVISHRFAALDIVDRVILIGDGKIVADGKKEDILKLLNSSYTITKKEFQHA
jgi:ATP-binding cassette subfamily B protein/ATP-binding cassette subfamily C protein LapB